MSSNEKILLGIVGKTLTLLPPYLGGAADLRTDSKVITSYAEERVSDKRSDQLSGMIRSSIGHVQLVDTDAETIGIDGTSRYILSRYRFALGKTAFNGY